MADISPTENKVWAATIGSGAGLAISQAVLWLLGVTVFGASSAAPKAADAVAAVPAPVAAFLAVLLTVGLAYAAGWRAKHTHRPDLMPDASSSASPSGEADFYMGSDTTGGPVPDAPVADPSVPADPAVPFTPPAVA